MVQRVYAEPKDVVNGGYGNPVMWNDSSARLSQPDCWEWFAFHRSRRHKARNNSTDDKTIA